MKLRNFTQVRRILVLIFVFIVILWLIIQHEYVSNCLNATNSKSCEKIRLNELYMAIRRADVDSRCYNEVNKLQSELLNGPDVILYIITPTYPRLVQKAELTRLSYCFKLVPSVHWIVVEDSEVKTVLVTKLLQNTLIPYTHLNIKTPAEFKMKETDPNWLKPRGVLQRNLGLEWIRSKLILEKDKGVVYFADDDNTYDLELFEEMRTTRKVSVWPVGLVGGLIVEKPLVSGGKVVGWNTLWKKERPFPVDMAGFAVNLELILRHPDALFDLSVPRGYQESHLLKRIVTVEELEPKGDNCTKVLVWHTRTEQPKLKQEKKLKIPSNLNIEV
ncbi:galactosylgalactosylxylosylprotein 3-beta-glucuronosyltransferase I-like [Centruroides vittatus]|uniref:galactosylgalactosylxylosylprotein 3-beta-glucuronosyltransferase I-like n=1 Tax=Centruroides vittatus TaxID=120091 RepID=UPI00350F480D